MRNNSFPTQLNNTAPDFDMDFGGSPLSTDDDSFDTFDVEEVLSTGIEVLAEDGIETIQSLSDEGDFLGAINTEDEGLDNDIEMDDEDVITPPANSDSEDDEVDDGVPVAATPLEFRTIDGTGNSQLDLGQIDEQLIRLFTPAFEDGIDVPRGGSFDASELPNPRTISNTIFTQEESVPNFLGASDWLWQWGQFVDHDLSLNEANEEFPPAPTDFTPIPVPNGDPVFADGTTLPFIRVTAAEGTGLGTDRPRQTINQITSFIDGSSVYGSTEERAEFLRTFSNGQLKTTDGDNAETLLPLNPVGEEALPNAAGGALGEFQYVAGDVRANEQTGLIAVHTLFVREHNRIAADLYDRLENQDAAIVERFEAFSETQADTPIEELKDEFIYEVTRKVVSAQIQQITYEEFLPLLIGEGTLEEYSGYNPTVIPSVSAEFANAAYRLGHTLLSNQIQRLNENGLDSISLADAFFNPEDIQANGIDSTLRGLILQEAQELDNLAVDGIRSFLFPAGTGGLDLPAINIARGRETGLPGYVEIFNQLFPENAITSFEDLPFREGLGGADGVFAQVYESVDQIDLFVGGVSELPDSHGGLLGPTFSAIIADQFGRVRDGDRFFYLSELTELNELYPDFETTTLSEVIRNNTQYDFLVTDNAFDVPFSNSVVGNDFNNILSGSGEADLIDGMAGDDVLWGQDAADVLLGEEGDDTVRGGRGNDTVLGGLDNDELFGNLGDDVLLGGDGDDELRGGGGDDTLIGGDGNDYVVGGIGNDYLKGAGESLGVDDLDTLVGAGDSDTYVLAENDALFYEGAGFATIRGFNLAQDTVQLLGTADDYTLTSVGGTTELSLAESDDLIAVFTGVESISDFQSGFTFI